MTLGLPQPNCAKKLIPCLKQWSNKMSFAAKMVPSVRSHSTLNPSLKIRGKAVTPHFSTIKQDKDYLPSQYKAYIAGLHNTIADCHSRLQPDRVYRLVPDAQKHPTREKSCGFQRMHGKSKQWYVFLPFHDNLLRFTYLYKHWRNCYISFYTQEGYPAFPFTERTVSWFVTRLARFLHTHQPEHT